MNNGKKFIAWYEVFVDAMRKAHKYTGPLDMEKAKHEFERGLSPTEYAEDLSETLVS